jgi:hypothetical protein
VTAVTAPATVRPRPTGLDFRVHTTALNNPDLIGLSPPAFRLWALMSLHSVGQGTDGHLADRAVAILPGVKAMGKLLQELGDAGLVARVDGGWRLRGFLTYQSSSEALARSRDGNRTRQQRHRDRRREGPARPEADESEGPDPEPTVQRAPPVDQDAPVTRYGDALVTGPAQVRAGQDREGEVGSGQVASDSAWAGIPVTKPGTACHACLLPLPVELWTVGTHTHLHCHVAA